MCVHVHACMLKYSRYKITYLEGNPFHFWVVYRWCVCACVYVRVCVRVHVYTCILKGLTALRIVTASCMDIIWDAYSPIINHYAEVTSSPSRKVMCVQAPGWTGRLWRWCLPPVSQMWALYFDDRRMVPGSLFPVPYQSWSTTILWEGSIGEIKFEAITAAELNAESSTSTFFTFCWTLSSLMHTSSRRATAAVFHSKPSEFRLQFTSELIGNHCSRRTAGCGSGAVRSLSLRHFLTTIPEEDPNKKLKYKRAWCCRCYSRSKKSVYTSWYCPECKVWLCH